MSSKCGAQTKAFLPEIFTGDIKAGFGGDDGLIFIGFRITTGFDYAAGGIEVALAANTGARGAVALVKGVGMKDFLGSIDIGDGTQAAAGIFYYS